MSRKQIQRGALALVLVASTPLARGQEVHGLCADLVRQQGHADCMHLDNGLTRIHVFEDSELSWDRLTIPTDQTLQFTFAQGGLTVVNRVLGTRPTQIRGTIDARGGSFVLLNPNSWLDVRDTARVLADNVILSGLDAETPQFFAREPSRVLRFSAAPQSNPNTFVKGKIQAEGNVVLVGKSLTAAVEIEAGGSVVMATGEEVQMRLDRLQNVDARGDQRHALVTGVNMVHAGGEIAVASPQLMNLVGNWIAGRGRGNVYARVNEGGRIEIGAPGLSITGQPKFSQQSVGAVPTIGLDEGDQPVVRTPAVNVRPTRGRRGTTSQDSQVRPRSGTVSARVGKTAFTRGADEGSSSQKVAISAKAMRGFYGLRMKMKKASSRGR